MNIDFEKIKKYLPLASLILAAVVVVLAVISYDACNVRDDLSLKLGEYKATVEANKKEKVELEASIAAKEKIILDKNTEIGNIKKETEKKLANIQEKDTQLDGVHKDMDAAQTDTARVLLFKKEVKIWMDKFTLSMGLIDDKNQEITAWTLKYAALEQIAQDYKTGWENEENQAIKCEVVRKELEKRLIKARFFSKATTIVAVAAVGYLAYNLLKK